MNFETMYAQLPDGRRFGPASVAEIAQWAAEGRIGVDALLVDAETGEMRTPAEFPEIAARFPRTLMSTLIPKNTWALASYYTGVGSMVGIVLCFVPGIIAGLAAIAMGILGLQRAKENPLLRGKGHCITGIVLGAFSFLVSAGLLIMIMIAS